MHTVTPASNPEPTPSGGRAADPAGRPAANPSRRNLLKGMLALPALGVAGALSACSSRDGAADAPGTPKTGTTGAAGSGAATGTGSLVVYSNSLSDGRGDWLAEQAKARGLTLNLVDLGGADVMNRLLAEKNNPVADVTFGLNNVYFEKLSAEGVLDPITPVWAGEVDATLGDGKQFWPIVREPIMLVYADSAYPKGAGAPADWPQLWTDPAFKGKYETPTSLGGATTQMVLSGIIARHLDPGGEYGVSAAGWEAVQNFFGNGSPAVKGTELFARLKSGEVTCGQMWLAGKKAREKQYGISTTAVQPTIGVPNSVQHVAAITGKGGKPEVRAFVDWFGSAEIQGQWSQQFFTAPANTKAKGDAEAVSMTDSFAVQKIDWKIVAANVDQWIEKIQLDYLKV